MNIMLVAVKERTREIGVRKALGATTATIQRQFFLEGLFLTLLSGGAGMLFALGLCRLVNLLPMPARFSGMVLSWQSGTMALVTLIAIGVSVGLAGALALSRALAGFLAGLGGMDTTAFAAASAILAAVAMLASYVPARRATKVDPMVALRYE